MRAHVLTFSLLLFAVRAMASGDPAAAASPSGAAGAASGAVADPDEESSAPAPDPVPGAAAKADPLLDGDLDRDLDDGFGRSSTAKGGPPPSGLEGVVSTFLKTMLMLGVVLGLAYLTLHKGVGKLVQRAQQGKRIKVVERVGLDPRRALYLIEVDGKEMLIASSEGGITRLGSVDEDDDDAAGSAPADPAAFERALAERRAAPAVSEPFVAKGHAPGGPGEGEVA